MHPFIIVLPILGAGALAQPDPSTPPIDRRGTGRHGHTAWIASYGVDDHTCSRPYLNGTQGDSDITRPTLTWTRGADPKAISKSFITLDGTDNVGIYFGTYQNHITYANFFNGGSGSSMSAVENAKGPFVCISAKAYGYPWTSVEGSG